MSNRDEMFTEAVRLAFNGTETIGPQGETIARALEHLENFQTFGPEPTRWTILQTCMIFCLKPRWFIINGEIKRGQGRGTFVKKTVDGETMIMKCRPDLLAPFLPMLTDEELRDNRNGPNKDEFIKSRNEMPEELRNVNFSKIKNIGYLAIHYGPRNNGIVNAARTMYGNKSFLELSESDIKDMKHDKDTEKAMLSDWKKMHDIRFAWDNQEVRNSILQGFP